VIVVGATAPGRRQAVDFGPRGPLGARFASIALISHRWNILLAAFWVTKRMLAMSKKKEVSRVNRFFDYGTTGIFQ